MTDRIAALAVLALLGGLAATPALTQKVPFVTVGAVTETEPVDLDPDDPAIWVNKADPEQSRVIGTDKDFGLVVFDLDGRIVQRLGDGRLNNVDIRQDVVVNGVKTSIVVASKREDNTIVVYTVDDHGVLSHATPFAFPGSPETIRYDIYGIGLYRDPTGTLSVISSFKTGDVTQYVMDTSGAEIGLTFARQWKIPTQPEGVVADDSLGLLYVGEEDGGVWRYTADPASPAEGVLIDQVGSECLPEDDIEGLAIYPTSADTGYLIASSQGQNKYIVYDRKPDAQGRQACVGTFSIITGATDPVGETDGLDVTATPLGPSYPRGLFVVQDDRNEGFTRNFKFVSWAEVEAALGLN